MVQARRNSEVLGKGVPATESKGADALAVYCEYRSKISGFVRPQNLRMIDRRCGASQARRTRPDSGRSGVYYTTCTSNAMIMAADIGRLGSSSTDQSGVECEQRQAESEHLSVRAQLQCCFHVVLNRQYLQRLEGVAWAQGRASSQARYLRELVYSPYTRLQYKVLPPFERRWACTPDMIGLCRRPLCPCPHRRVRMYVTQGYG